jgi:hypothetical protein
MRSCTRLRQDQTEGESKTVVANLSHAGHARLAPNQLGEAWAGFRKPQNRQQTTYFGPRVLACVYERKADKMPDNTKCNEPDRSWQKRSEPNTMGNFFETKCVSLCEADRNVG